MNVIFHDHKKTVFVVWEKWSRTPFTTLDDDDDDIWYKIMFPWQAAEFEEKINKLKAIVSEKEKEIEEKTKALKSKDLEINELKDSFEKEKEEIKKQVSVRTL